MVGQVQDKQNTGGRRFYNHQGRFQPAWVETAPKPPPSGLIPHVYRLSPGDDANSPPVLQQMHTVPAGMWLPILYIFFYAPINRNIVANVEIN